jgi:glycosyltransferase involved in cell wall biosynthesis
VSAGAPERHLAAVPKVSVIVATYNRPAVLRQALLALQTQTERDWEAWVVGDACTDSTGDTVASLADPRIRFHNLAEPCGEQSGPNNQGIALATAPVLAFLNHDDLWFPDHLELALKRLEADGADLVFSVGASMRAQGGADLLGRPRGGRYWPGEFVPATGWVFRRGLAARVGPWRRGRELYNIPSQDWIFRAHRAGASLIGSDRLTFLAVQSAYRPGCYIRGDDSEQVRLRAEMGRSGWRDALEAECRREEEERASTAGTSARLRRTAVHLFNTLCGAAGVHPLGVRQALRYRSKGGRIRELRRIRGLPASGQ